MKLTFTMFSGFEDDPSVEVYKGTSVVAVLRSDSSSKYYLSNICTYLSYKEVKQIYKILKKINNDVL